METKHLTSVQLSESLPKEFEKQTLSEQETPKQETGQNVCPPVETIAESTDTKGNSKGVKSSLELQTENETKQELSKNALFTRLYDSICPVKFDDTELRKGLQNLVAIGAMNSETLEQTISANRKCFYAEHESELNAFESTTFEDFCVMVANSIYANDLQKVLGFTLSTERKSNYITADGKVKIYHSEQGKDKDGKDKYSVEIVSLKSRTLNKTFSATTFFELRDYSVTNLLLAIRFRSAFDACFNSVSRDRKQAEKPLSDFWRCVDALRNLGLSDEQIKDLI